MKIIPNSINAERLPTGLQNQHTGYSYNLPGGAPPNLVKEFASSTLSKFSLPARPVRNRQHNPTNPQKPANDTLYLNKISHTSSTRPKPPTPSVATTERSCRPRFLNSSMCCFSLQKKKYSKIKHFDKEPCVKC